MQQSTTYSIPGKIFLLGEYAVLSGLPALVAAIPPVFTLSSNSCGNAPSHSAFHPASPIAKLLGWARQQGLPPLHVDFQDPHSGRGGFGASTAQFAMTLAALLPSSDWQFAWNLYRMLMKHPTLTPSGADLVCQWQGGVILFDPTHVTCQDWTPALDLSHLLIFSATHQKDRKVPTHTHLESSQLRADLASGGALSSQLSALLQQAQTAVKKREMPALGQVLSSYAATLRSFDLELPATTADCQAFRALPGVLGAKGTGALQADSLIVLIQEEEHRQAVLDLARDRNLILLPSPKHQPGLTNTHLQRGPA